MLEVVRVRERVFFANERSRGESKSKSKSNVVVVVVVVVDTVVDVVVVDVVGGVVKLTEVKVEVVDGSELGGE